MKRKKYFDEERAFEFIWQNADRDGIWHGDAIELAAEFDVSEDTADSVLATFATVAISRSSIRGNTSS